MWRDLGPSRLLRDGGGHHVVVGDAQDGVGGLNLTVNWCLVEKNRENFVVRRSQHEDAGICAGGRRSFRIGQSRSMSAMEVGLDRVVGELVEKLVRFWAVG